MQQIGQNRGLRLTKDDVLVIYSDASIKIVCYSGLSTVVWNLCMENSITFPLLSQTKSSQSSSTTVSMPPES